jgi:hypothetical protein
MLPHTASAKKHTSEGFNPNAYGTLTHSSVNRSTEFQTGVGSMFINIHSNSRLPLMANFEPPTGESTGLQTGAASVSTNVRTNSNQRQAFSSTQFRAFDTSGNMQMKAAHHSESIALDVHQQRQELERGIGQACEYFGKMHRVKRKYSLHLLQGSTKVHRNRTERNYIGRGKSSSLTGALTSSNGHIVRNTVYSQPVYVLLGRRI